MIVPPLILSEWTDERFNDQVVAFNVLELGAWTSCRIVREKVIVAGKAALSEMSSDQPKHGKCEGLC